MEELKPILLRTDVEATLSEGEIYQRMTGLLMFSMIETRPNIAFSTLVMSRFSKNLLNQHIKAEKSIFQYLKDIRDQSIIYGGKDKLFFEGYSNSDLVSNKESRKSTSSYIFMLNRGLVS